MERIHRATDEWKLPFSNGWLLGGLGQTSEDLRQMQRKNYWNQGTNRPWNLVVISEKFVPSALRPPKQRPKPDHSCRRHRKPSTFPEALESKNLRLHCRLGEIAKKNTSMAEPTAAATTELARWKIRQNSKLHQTSLAAIWSVTALFLAALKQTPEINDRFSVNRAEAEFAGVVKWHGDFDRNRQDEHRVLALPLAIQ
jgi:hypothetical protein